MAKMAKMAAGVLLHCYVLSVPTVLWSPDAHSEAWHLCQGCFCAGLGKLSRERIAGSVAGGERKCYGWFSGVGPAAFLFMLIVVFVDNALKLL